MNVAVVGIFDSLTLAEQARKALLHAGVPEGRIAFDVSGGGICSLQVGAQSSLERERIRDVLRRSGAAYTGQQSAGG